MTILAGFIGLIVGYLLASLLGGTPLAAAVAGAIFAGFACAVVSDVKLGASQRTDAAGGGGALGLLIVGAAVVVAALTLLFSPVAILFGAGLIWLAVSRSRRSDRKHAGLRVLR